MRRPALRPEHIDVVNRELSIRGHQLELLQLSLGHEEPIEGIAMVKRQTGDVQRVPMFD